MAGRRPPASCGRQPARSKIRGSYLAWAGGGVLALLLLVTAGTLPVTLAWHDVQSLDVAIRHPPSFQPVVSLDRFADAGRRREPPPTTVPSESALSTLQGDGEASRTEGAVRGADTVELSLGRRFCFRASSWLGHDDLGRSLLLRLLPGFLVSLAIGLAAAGVAVVVGTSWGVAAALGGARLDTLLMRIVDVLYGLPYILMVIVLKVGLTPLLTPLLGERRGYAELMVLFVAIGLVSWLTLARVIRGQVLSLRSRGYVEAARAAGAGPVHVLRRHVLPEVIGPVMVYATLVIPQAVLQESFLSFLGIGVQPPLPSLGRLAAEGVEAVNTFVGFWWLLAFPCGTLVLSLVALNLVGDAIRDAFDRATHGRSLV